MRAFGVVLVLLPFACLFAGVVRDAGWKVALIGLGLLTGVAVSIGGGLSLVLR